MRFSEHASETNEDWLRGKFSPILNFFSLTDVENDNEKLAQIINDEKQRALNALELIKSKIESYK